jgi:hypothetical protein
MPRIVCNAATTGASVQPGNIASISAVSRSHRSDLDGGEIIFQDDVMDRLLEPEPDQP